MGVLVDNVFWRCFIEVFFLVEVVVNFEMRFIYDVFKCFIFVFFEEIEVD